MSELTPGREGLARAAEQLRALHAGPEPLVLPNVWDAASARAVADAGFPAVATTSSGVSAALGWPDGEQTPADEMFAAIFRVARSVDVPVTADIEGGYGLSPEEVVQRLLDAGAVGCNLEDTNHGTGAGLVDASGQADRLAAVKRVARAAGVNIVLNARVDVFLRQAVPGQTPIEEAIRRGRLYVDAGADCVFPIGAPDEGAIAALVDGIPGPINVIAGFRGAPGQARLRELGVRRISYAGGLHRVVFAELKRRVAAIRVGEEL
ncbi:MAG TPA: isocitrate lyase/phosphoenolpyruvate mutase family protein [Chloroflexota bacterium]|nr:isocitrate lyase/phosphoenolpyruvate mutase family protein [Chloroflexota bacterium]